MHSLYEGNYGVSGHRQHSIRVWRGKVLHHSESITGLGRSWPGSRHRRDPRRVQPASPSSQQVGPAVKIPRPLGELNSLPWACALQAASDGSSSEGSTVDFLDPEEILKKIPELAEDLEEPEDCFTEGNRHEFGPESSSTLIQHLCVPGPGLGCTGDRAPCCLTPRLEGPASDTSATTQGSPGGAMCISCHVGHDPWVLCPPRHPGKPLSYELTLLRLHGGKESLPQPLLIRDRKDRGGAGRAVACGLPCHL